MALPSMVKRSDPSEMTLDDAIRLLCGVHLRAVEFDDWHILMGAMPDTPWDHQGYPSAWAALRKHMLARRYA